MQQREEYWWALHWFRVQTKKKEDQNQGKSQIRQYIVSWTQIEHATYCRVIRAKSNSYSVNDESEKKILLSDAKWTKMLQQLLTTVLSISFCASPASGITLSQRVLITVNGCWEISCNISWGGFFACFPLTKKVFTSDRIHSQKQCSAVLFSHNTASLLGFQSSWAKMLVKTFKKCA